MAGAELEAEKLVLSSALNLKINARFALFRSFGLSRQWDGVSLIDHWQ